MATLPRAFFVPAEEDPHQMTLMQWPTARSVYRRKQELAEIQALIAKIANTIAEFEPVVMLAATDEHATARQQLGGNTTLWDIPTDDLWCRDSGPLFVVDGKGGLAISHIQFNGWGDRFSLPNDTRIAERVAQHMNVPIYDSSLVGEAGGAEANGHGLVIANASSWVNRNRNPGLDRAEVSGMLSQAYGADRVFWGKGVKGQDITDDHIDGLARFTAPDRVLMQHDVSDPSDPYTKSAIKLRADLEAAGLKVDTVPYATRGRIRQLGIYVNFLVCNGAIITSEFGDKQADDQAHDALKRHYPDHEIVMLNTDYLTELGGGIHCATQQVPAV